MNEIERQGAGMFRDRYTRAETRFAIDANCRFWWTGESEQTCLGAGRTVDVSSHGIFVATPSSPPYGTVVMLEVDLPRIHRGAAEDLRDPAYLLFSAEGIVLRPNGAEEGFAAKISHASFAAKQKEDSSGELSRG